MEKRTKYILISAGAGLLVASWLPIFPDPFYHQDKICFWEWLRREIYEVLYGERAKLMLQVPIPQHNVNIEYAVEEILAEKDFMYSVELGCGLGGLGVIIRPHTQWLVGVDSNVDYLENSNPVYDRLVHADLRACEFSELVDSVFLFEVLEHISKEEGHILLSKLQGKYVLLSTPDTFYSDEKTNHLCVWSVEELHTLGFTVWSTPSSPGNTLIAERYSQ